MNSKASMARSVPRSFPCVEGFADADCDGHPDFLDVYEDDGFCDTDIPRGAIDDSDFGEPFQPVAVADPKAYACGCEDASTAPASTIRCSTGPSGCSQRSPPSARDFPTSREIPRSRSPSSAIRPR